MFDNCFDRVLVINLDERPDKWSRMEKRLTSAGIENFERLPGIRRELGDFPSSMYSGMNLKRVPPERISRYLAGSCGCKLSHANAIQLARDRGYKRVLILEDDAILTKDALPRFANAWRELEEYPWDMLYLGGRHRSRRKAHYHSPNLIRVLCTYQTHAYAVAQSGYDVLLEKIKCSNNEVDVLYADYVQPFCKCYAVYPNIFDQDQAVSDIVGFSSKRRKQRRPWSLLSVVRPLGLKLKKLYFPIK
jgi:hypothetical protein